ncbi:MAG: hypothetical protein LJE70_17980 [Chromatiaceae bacterium]|nr:hypothetical protein [Chromatiaceae bacterium]
MPTQRRITGNPVARSPLLRKGGAHQRARSGERQRQRADLEAALEQWQGEEKIVFDSGVSERLGDQEQSAHTETHRHTDTEDRRNQVLSL